MTAAVPVDAQPGGQFALRRRALRKRTLSFIAPHEAIDRAESSRRQLREDESTRYERVGCKNSVARGRARFAAESHLCTSRAGYVTKIRDGRRNRLRGSRRATAPPPPAQPPHRRQADPFSTGSTGTWPAPEALVTPAALRNQERLSSRGDPAAATAMSPDVTDRAGKAGSDP
jgi:hypothetical protein